jgi:hypothetical protein
MLQRRKQQQDEGSLTPYVSLADVTPPMVVRPHKFQEQYNAIYWTWWERIAPCPGDLMQQYVEVEFAREDFKTDDYAIDSMMKKEANIVTSLDDNTDYCSKKVHVFGPHLLTFFDQAMSLLLCTGTNPSCKS